MLILAFLAFFLTLIDIISPYVLFKLHCNMLHSNSQYCANPYYCITCAYAYVQTYFYMICNG